MNCTKNPKKFLFINWNGPHKMAVVRFGKFMHCSNNYIVLFECKHCGCQHKENFVSEELLLTLGIPIEEIVKHRSIIY